MKKYFDEFESIKNIKNEFGIADINDDEIIFACYNHSGYEGNALIIFKRDNKLFEVNAGHCSCYGLEGQWEPEETTIEALKHRAEKGYGIIEEQKNIIFLCIEEMLTHAG